MNYPKSQKYDTLKFNAKMMGRNPVDYLHDLAFWKKMFSAAVLRKK